MEKLLFFLIVLNAALLSNQVYLHLILMFGLAASFLIAGLSLSKMCRLFALPLGFVILGSLSIAISPGLQDTWLNWKIFGIAFGISREGVQQALLIFCKAMASVMALNYLILSSPLSELIEMGRKLRVPSLFIELFVLSYRYIVLLLGLTKQVQIAQRSRLGYTSKRKAMGSMGLLLSSVFINSLKYAQQNIQAMQSRGYCGDFYFNNQMPKIRISALVGLLILAVLLIIIHFYFSFLFQS